MPITYLTNQPLDLDTVLDLYLTSTLAERRPVADRDRMARMIDQANLTVTAWDADLLVGIARSLTDFAYACYLSNLAVRASHQRQGIGLELIRQTQSALHPEAKIILLAAPAAVEYYPHIGFSAHPSAWILKANDEAGR